MPISRNNTHHAPFSLARDFTNIRPILPGPTPTSTIQIVPLQTSSLQGRSPLWPTSITWAFVGLVKTPHRYVAAGSLSTTSARQSEKHIVAGQENSGLPQNQPRSPPPQVALDIQLARSKMSVDANELLDAFKAAALSVTKLYKTSAQAQSKSRADGYQDCLEDLLSFLDREQLGLQSGEGQRIRKWATDRTEGRDATSPPLESDDEADRSDAPVSSSPQLQRAVPAAIQLLKDKIEVPTRDSSAPPVLTTALVPPSPAAEGVDVAVPSQDTFNFSTPHPYPHDEALRLANLNLSDPQTISPSNPRTSRSGRNKNGRATSRTSLGRGAGQKRKVNLAEIFDLGSLDHGNVRDVFGGGGKRSRFT